MVMCLHMVSTGMGALISDMLPRSITLRRGLIVSHAGGGTTYRVAPNLDATTNLSTFVSDETVNGQANYSDTNYKFDVMTASTSGSSSNVNNLRMTDVRNSVDGLGISSGPRTIGIGTNGRGLTLISSEFTLQVTDEDGANIPGATVYIPSATAGTIGPISFDQAAGQGTGLPAVTRMVNDATITATTGADGFAASSDMEL